MTRSYLYFLLLHIFGVFGAASTRDAPIDCFTRSNMDEFMDCFNGFIKLRDELTFAEWNRDIKPTQSQIQAWRSVVNSMLRQADSCENIEVPAAISDSVVLKSFNGRTKGGSERAKHCILLETSYIDRKCTSSTTGKEYTCRRFKYGWGLFAAPAKGQNILRKQLHFSAAHPLFDGDVHYQAAYLYDRIGAKSLVITGAHRNTVNDKQNNPAQCDKVGSYNVMDPSHSLQTMFHHVMLQVLDYQKSVSRGGNYCPFNDDSDSCLFVQFHGMGTNSCKGTTMLMSVGASASVGRRVYNDRSSTINKLSRRIVQEGRTAGYQNWLPHNPVQASRCYLAGTRNPFGRVLNGVPATRACATGANARSSDINGAFIHIEQKRETRVADVFPVWDKAFRKLMPHRK